jgi:hypothetical protein
MPVIPENLSPEQQDDQSLSVIKINKILSDRLPALVSGKIPVDANLNVGAVTITGVAQETTLSAINTKLPSSLTVTSTRLLVDGSGVTQPVSGTVSSNLRDGAGNALTSTAIGSTRRLDVNLSSAGTAGATVPTVANLYGGSDGTNLRPVSVDTSGRVNVNVNPSGTSVSLSSFSLTTVDSSLVTANTSRKALTVFNTGPGLLYIAPGATCSTSSYQVRLSAGDYWEAPLNQVTIAHSAVFATAGSAAVTSIT